MFLPKSDVFKDLSQDTIDDISRIAVEKSLDEGVVIFSPGDPADYFYILEQGKVSLNTGNATGRSYVVERLGEAFGWPAVVGDDSYCMEARCLAPTTLWRIEGKKLDEIFDLHERSGRKFYTRLSSALGQRLRNMHQ